MLDDGTGRVSPRLQPLHQLLLASTNPSSTRRWLYRSQVSQVLSDLATGRLDLSHEALRADHDPRMASHLGGLLVTCGLLPDTDKLLLDYESWLQRRLTTLAGHPHERLLRQFGQWDQLPRLRAAAANRPLRPTAHHNARRRFGAAMGFVDWLHERDLDPTALTQADIDTWYLTHNVAQRQVVVAFWNWATTNGHIPRHLRMPRMRFNTGQAITQHRRLNLLRHFVSDEDTPLPARVALCILLLYGQPLGRILRIKVDDVVRDPDGQLVLNLGEPAVPVPEPFAALLVRLMHSRYGHSAVNPITPWLFPGRTPGQPVSREWFVKQLRRLGVPIRGARVSALRQLVTDVPAPVVAAALGFHRTTTARQTANAGATWNRYAAGDHTPLPK